MPDMSASPTPEQLRAAIGDLPDPEIGRSLAALDMLKSVELREGRAQVEVELPTPAYPDRERISQAIGERIGQRFPGVAADVRFSSQVRGKKTGGTIGLNVANIIAVGSGKGGVGKSTVAATLAYGLLNSGARVALLDADVYGPSIPHLVGLKGQPVIKTVQLPDGRSMDRIEPLVSSGLKVMSMGFMIGEDQAVIWRGPMLHKWLTQLLHQTDWGPLDYLVIDMPPGTGDVALTLSQAVQIAGAVVVCTPQQVALLDAVKAISMFNQVKIPVLGVVENMSGEMFGRGGARAKAEQLQLPFLGEIPSDPQIRICGDEGRIADLFKSDSASRGPLLRMCERTAIRIARNLLETPQLPTLEIL
jgi:ATP-binding protein involved in chromosome partitioning